MKAIDRSRYNLSNDEYIKLEYIFKRTANRVLSVQSDDATSYAVLSLMGITLLNASYPKVVLDDIEFDDCSPIGVANKLYVMHSDLFHYLMPEIQFKANISNNGLPCASIMGIFHTLCINIASSNVHLGSIAFIVFFSYIKNTGSNGLAGIIKRLYNKDLDVMLDFFRENLYDVKRVMEFYEDNYDADKACNLIEDWINKMREG